MDYILPNVFPHLKSRALYNISIRRQCNGLYATSMLIAAELYVFENGREIEYATYHFGVVYRRSMHHYLTNGHRYYTCTFDKNGDKHGLEKELFYNTNEDTVQKLWSIKWYHGNKIN